MPTTTAITATTAIAPTTSAIVVRRLNPLPFVGMGGPGCGGAKFAEARDWASTVAGCTVT